jgi:hypothetical protein
MPVFEQRSLKSLFLASLSFRNMGNPMRPELYLAAVGLALLVWLFRPLEHLFFHWPMIFAIGLTGLIVQAAERQKKLAPTPDRPAAPAPPLILQLFHDFTSAIPLVLPLTMAAAFVSPTQDLMFSLALEVMFPLLNLRFASFTVGSSAFRGQAWSLYLAGFAQAGPNLVYCDTRLIGLSAS